MKYVIDRIEGCFAVCENEKGIMQDIMLSSLPEGVKEGMTLFYENCEYQLGEVPAEQKTKLRKKMNRLWK